MYTVYCGRVCCNFSKLSDADYFARKNGTVVFGIARTENEKGVKKYLKTLIKIIKEHIEYRQQIFP